MFFCPYCNNMFDIAKIFKEQIGGDEYKAIIDKILSDEDKSKVDSLKSSIEIQNDLLKNFEISLPTDLNLNLKQKKGVYYYLKEGLTIIAVTGVIGYITLELLVYFQLI